MVTSLSNGQVRVQEITRSVLRDFPNDPLGTLAQEALLTRLEEDHIVREDEYTGCSVIYKSVAVSYSDWLQSKSQKLQMSAIPAIKYDFNKMHFMGSAVGRNGGIDPEIRMYDGGTKPDSMAWALLTLMSGRDMEVEHMAICYLVHNGVTRITEGNHRSLAYKLLGRFDFPSLVLTCYTDPPANKPLNQALLYLESLVSVNGPTLDIGDNIEYVIDLAEKIQQSQINGRNVGLYNFIKDDWPKLLDTYHPGYQPLILDILPHYLRTYQDIIQPVVLPFWRKWIANISVKSSEIPTPTFRQQEFRNWLLKNHIEYDI